MPLSDLVTLTCAQNRRSNLAWITIVFVASAILAYVLAGVAAQSMLMDSMRPKLAQRGEVLNASADTMTRGSSSSVLDTDDIPWIMERDAKTLCTIPFDRVNRAFADQARGADADDPLVIVTALHGLADSFKGTVAGFYFALLAGARFYADWGDSTHGVLWEDIFSASSLTWSLSSLPQWARNANVIHTVELRSYKLTPESSKIRAAISSGDGVDGVFEGRPVLHLISNFNVRAFHNPKLQNSWSILGLTRETYFGCAISYLFRPLPSVYRGAAHAFIRLLRARDAGDVIVGIHIRAGARTDSSFRNELAPDALYTPKFESFWSCAEQIGAEVSAMRGITVDQRRVLWVLASDVGPLRHDAIARFGSDRIVTQDASPKHVRIDNSPATLRSAVSDLWLLSLADAFVLSSNSGFGRVAADLRNQALGVRPTFYINTMSLSVASAVAPNCTMRLFKKHLPL